jgi:DNA-binding NtrC family response regulator
MQGEQLQVLLVDDEEALRDLGQAMLTRLGYAVVACATSPDALATFAAAPEQFALVMTDYTMPALTGPQFAVACQHLRPDLPVLLVTGWLEVPEAGHEPAPAQLAVLHKPFSLQELARTMQSLVGTRPPEEDPVRAQGRAS